MTLTSLQQSGLEMIFVIDEVFALWQCPQCHLNTESSIITCLYFENVLGIVILAFYPYGLHYLASDISRACKF
jgi:hypothetical protein